MPIQVCISQDKASVCQDEASAYQVKASVCQDEASEGQSRFSDGF